VQVGVQHAAQVLERVVALLDLPHRGEQRREALLEQSVDQPSLSPK